MSRFKKPEYPYHTAILRCDQNNGELVLVDKGPRAYLGAGKDGDSAMTFSGQTKLRKLARLILKNVPARKK